MDFSQMTPEQLEHIKERMRSRGMTDEQIEERIELMRKRTEAAKAGQDGASGTGHGQHSADKPTDRP